MSDQRTLPPRGQSFADQPYAFDPVAQPQLFNGVIGKRTVAFIIDAMIILVLTGASGLGALAAVYGGVLLLTDARHRLRLDRMARPRAAR